MVLSRRAAALRLAVLGLPLLAVLALIFGPLLLTLIVSFWERRGLTIAPAFSPQAYDVFLTGVRLEVLERSLIVGLSATAIMLLVAYPVAYIVTLKVRPQYTRAFLFLFAVPFLVNYIVRTFSWSYLLARNGPINSALMWLGLTDRPVDWLLFSDFAVYLGLVTAYTPFMIFPIWLSLSGIDRRYLEASWVLGEPPAATFLRVTLPLSLPGVFAAAIFGFVGSFGEVAVSTVLGGVGYQLMGNAITSSLDVLNYPLAAAMSTVAVALMLALLLLWYRLFDVRLLLGKIIGGR